LKIKADLYNFLFHYNNFNELWYCYRRDRGNEYFNGEHRYVGKGVNIREAYYDCKSKLPKNDNV